MAIEVHLIDRAEALAALEPDWAVLWERCPEATIFLRPEWQIAWWRHFHPGDLATLALFEAGRLVALAPLYREDGPWGRRLLPVAISLSDYLDVLFDPAEAARRGPALAEAMVTARDDVDALSLEDLPPCALALSLPCPQGWDERVEPQITAPVLAMPNGVDDLSSVIPPGQRRSLRMTRHRAARRGASVTLAGPDDIDAALADLMRLHQARWEAVQQSGLLADRRVGAFLADVVPQLLSLGFVRLYRLWIEGVCIGAYLGFVGRGRALAYFGGYDPAFSFESPGTWLMGHAIDEAAAEGATEFHFLRGKEAYKYAWGARDRFNMRRIFSRPDRAAA